MGILRPQVIVSENVLTSFIAPAGDRNVAMIGSAQWGPINTVTIISNLSKFAEVFGDETVAGVTGIKGSDLFFRNGGTMKFIRVVDGDEAKSVYSAQKSATDELDFSAVHYGTYGNNITIEILANSGTPANRDFKITDGKTLELFNNNGTGFATNTEIVAAITGNSNFVTVALAGTGTAGNVPDAITPANLTLGDDGENSLSDANYTDAFDNLLLTEDFNFLLIPGKDDNAFHSSILGRLDSRASAEKKYSRYITGIAVDETITTALARTASGKRLSVLAPNVKYTNRYDNSAVVLDGSYLACAYAGMLCAKELQISGTHETVSVNGLSINETSGKEYYTKAEQEQLLNGPIMPVSLIGGAIQCVRAVTTYNDNTSVWFEEVVVDIIDYTREQAENYLNTVIGKPNTSENRSVYSARLNAIMTSLQREEIIQEFIPSIVEEGASPDTIIATIGVKPAYSTNFVNLTININ